MATPKPGEIRCPTCHRSTPPAAYCTQCGSAIPSDARARPRGMDRDELQDRIRARRSGGEPYRRGGPADDAGYARFEPEPEDANVMREQPVDQRRTDYFDDSAAPPPPPPATHDRGDLTRDTDDWTAPVPPVADAGLGDAPPREDDRTAAAAAAAAAATGDPAADAEPLESYDYDDAVGYPYEYDSWEDRRERRSGSGAFAIIGFLALGVLALLGGAVLAGVFSGGGGVADATPTPEIIESSAPSASEAPSVAPSVAPSAAASAAPVESGEPVVFPDGFVAVAEPCFPGSAGQDGCNSNGAQNGGVVDIWVGFENGNASDVIGAAIIGPDGNTLTEGSIDLANIGCGTACNGWTFFNFRNLEPGTYQVRVTRNGEFASSTSFEVS
ncbi:MAG TPA: hypothetical protein VFT09_00905 [Ilumatobacteraceae bacterium]|nr:hypothetical protein [Ilumatobacteraceae bacterium]